MQRLSIKTYVLGAVTFVVLIVTGAILFFQYLYIAQSIDKTVQKRFADIVEKISLHIQDRNRVIEAVLYEMGYDDGFIQPLHPYPKKMIERILYTMHRYDKIYAFDYADREGNFLQIIDIKNHPEAAKRFHPDKDVARIVIRVFQKDGKRTRIWDYLDEKGAILASKEEPARFDARNREWFRGALSSEKIYRTGAYRFKHYDHYGVTFSKRIGDRGVVAVDLTHADLTRFFKQQVSTSHAYIVMFDKNGRIIAATTNAPIVESIKNRLFEKRFEKVGIAAVEGDEYLVLKKRLSKSLEPDTWLGFAVSEAYMKRPYMREIYMTLLVAAAILLLSLPFVYLAAGRIVRPIRALMVENEKIAHRRYEEVTKIDTPIEEIGALSDSLVSMADSVKNHERSLRRMIEAFVRIIAEAIDEKSRYTGRHCERVPKIAVALARAAHESGEGSLAGFRLDEEAFKAFEMGAWLHDCGKITTPEYVVDKATKLETIHNRIHEIRTRFEVLWRDAEIAYRDALLNGEEEERARKRLHERQKRLEEDFAFVARCNLGEIPLSDKDIARLKRIARQTWRRHFDDRLGLSEAELARRGTESRPLPAKEPLLADRPEHCIPREHDDASLYAREKFVVEIPEWQYHRGELYNLSIRRGTLTPEERFKIEEHAMMTIRMLEKVPYPPGYKKIPLYAGTHHETPDGKGYPRRLSGEDLPIEGRIMAIADIFEALTASDRPYKKAKTLTQALTIMAYMVKEGKLDREVFALFLRAKIWQEYAKSYLKEEQRDPVDIDAILKIIEG